MLQTIKQSILRLLRNTKLLNLADRVLLYIRITQAAKDNRKYSREHPGIKFPPYHIYFDVFGGCRHRGYHEGGLSNAKSILGTIDKYKSGNVHTICEWGCGPARVLQYIRTVDPAITRVIGFDYNIETIEWCKNNFTDIEFYRNSLGPPLSIDAESVDVLYCISVFTHLSEEMHYAWIQEILRVLKPGGLFIGTFHGENTKHKLFKDELAKYNNGELVVRGNVYEGSKNFVAFHSDNFVRSKLLRNFANIEHVPWPDFFQTVYCAVKSR